MGKQDRSGTSDCERDRTAHGPSILSLPTRMAGHLLSAGVQAAVDFLIEDLCALCRSQGPRRGEWERKPVRYSSHFLKPVTTAFLGVFPLRSHPVCARCAAGLEPAGGAGLLGTAAPSAVVTTTRGERFGAPGGAPGRGARTPLRIPIVSPFMTNDNTLQIIHLVKFDRYEALIPPLVRAVRDARRRHGVIEEGTVLVATPANPGTRAGGNLPERMAELLGHEFDIPLIKRTLRKVRQTARQSQTAHEERARNVRGAFVCSDAGLLGKRVILVDDLVTTGATAASCAGAILQSGAGALEVLCFARAL